jgi:hypothetical protein
MKASGKIDVTLKAKIALGPKLRTTTPAPGRKISPYLLRNAVIERPKNVFDTPGRFSAICQTVERSETDALQSKYYIPCIRLGLIRAAAVRAACGSAKPDFADNDWSRRVCHCR